MKVSRHAKIIELISQYDIETQEELAEYLNNAGFKVTQATVSRDIRDLKLSKVSTGSGHQKYILHRIEEPGMSEKYIRVLKDGYVAMDMAQNILVIKTVSGMAMAVAAAVDAMKWHEVVGCIAGDDTIMCAIRSCRGYSEHVMDKIRKIVSRGSIGEWYASKSTCEKYLALIDEAEVDFGPGLNISDRRDRGRESPSMLRLRRIWLSAEDTVRICFETGRQVRSGGADCFRLTIRS